MIDAYILIGGESTRMGSDKALVEVDGLPMAKITLNTLRSADKFSGITFVAGNDAQFAMSAVALGARFIFDIYPDRGPLSGLHAALADATTEWIFVSAVDYPFANVGMIEILARMLSDEFGAVVAEQEDGRMQPLFAFYKAEQLKPIIAEIVEKQRSTPPMREIVERLVPRIVPFGEYSHLADASRIFTNINTPYDLAARPSNE